jgi:acyl-CoA synthetase (AMP-forming)/AMP-acid ligase II
VNIVDEIEHFVAALAVMRRGAWQLAIASHDTPAIHQELAARLGITHLLTDGGAKLPAADVRRWPQPPGEPVMNEEAHGGFYFRTSGTTGVSNLVPLSTASLVAQARRNPEYLGARYLRQASVEHNNGKRHRLVCAYVGGTNVFGNGDRRGLAAFCARHGVTRMDLSLMHAAELLATAGPDDFSAIELYVAGSASPHRLRAALEAKVTRRLFTRYATTEFGTVSICRPGEHDADEPAGRPVDGVELEIVDEAGLRLGCGETGQIRLRGEGMATGYHDSPQQTDARFRDGWFWPGDMGLLREDGSLVIKGRTDEMIILNGINIFPAEIERVLGEHTGVATAAAAGVLSPVHGQIPVAAVELVRGASTTADELLAFARSRMALRAPRKIVIVEALPRSPQGKLLRRAVAGLFEKERAT